MEGGIPLGSSIFDNIQISFPPSLALQDCIIRKENGDFPSKSPNCFILYRRAFHKELQRRGFKLKQKSISTMVSRSWKRLSPEIKQSFKDLAKQAHNELIVIRRRRFDKDGEFFPAEIMNDEPKFSNDKEDFIVPNNFNEFQSIAEKNLSESTNNFDSNNIRICPSPISSYDNYLKEIPCENKNDCNKCLGLPYYSDFSGEPSCNFFEIGNFDRKGEPSDYYNFFIENPNDEHNLESLDYIFPENNLQFNNCLTSLDPFSPVNCNQAIASYFPVSLSCYGKNLSDEYQDFEFQTPTRLQNYKPHLEGYQNENQNWIKPDGGSPLCFVPEYYNDNRLD
ncbi:hypothetical protein G9A89_004429 [Geosiphon pyriformis]|nr:hypothetical protein G9A89_004429 [Geosiphon pyriformis]